MVLRDFTEIERRKNNILIGT